ncbi:MAG TPA: molybdenum cofactor guanylyltransferase [Puia sp.]
MSTTGKLLGVVLCGGESLRMGRDKGLLQTDGQPWVLRMGEKLTQQQLPVVYSINKKQVSTYSAWLPDGQIVIDADRGAGPLKGLLSVHRRYPDHHLLTVACDMQDLDTATIVRLISAWRETSADFYAYEVDGFLQPFCAIYRSEALTRGEAAASLRELLNSGVLHRMPGTAAAFRNYNTL